MTEERPETRSGEEPAAPETEIPGDGQVEEAAPGEAELERRLAEPILQGHQGIETAQVWIGAFLIVIASVIAYSNAFTLPIHLEDRMFFGESRGLPQLTALGAALEARPAEPLAVVAIAKNRWLGESPGVFHGVNILLHAAGAVLVYLLCRRVLRPGAAEPVAMLAGLIFALHPLNTEAVNYIVGRALLQGVMFGSVSLLLFLRSMRDDRVEILPLAGSLLFLILAWGSTPLVLPLPVLALAADRIVRGGPMRSGAVAHLAYWGVFLVLLMAHTVAFSTPAGAADVHLLPLAGRIAALGRLYGATVYPYGLSVHHPLPDPADLTSGPVLLAGLVTVLLAVGGLVLAWRRSPAGFGLMWYVLFALTAVLLARPDSVVDERLAYLPLAGGAMLLPWAFGLVPGRPALRTVAGIGAAVLVAAAGIGAYLRNQVWQTEDSLWLDAAAKHATSAEPHRVLGTLRLSEGNQAMSEAAFLAAQNAAEQAAERRQAALSRFRAAEEQFRAALEKKETPSAEVLHGLGQALEYLGQLAEPEQRQARLEEAAGLYRETLRRDPQNGDALVRLAFLTDTLAGMTGDRRLLARALEYYERARQTEALPAEMQVRYGQALAAVGAFERGRQVLTEAAQRQPQGPAMTVLEQQVGPAAQNLGRLQQAAALAQQQAPGSEEALRLRAQLLAYTGHHLQASYVLEEVLARNPQDAGAWTILGVTLARLGSADRFVAEWAGAAPPAAGTDSPWRLLARSTAATGEWEAARTYLDVGRRAESGPTVDPLLALGDIAAEIGANAQAAGFFREYAESRPDDPAPWLRLTDLALAQNDLPNARNLYAEAARRNAPESELAARRERLGDVPSASPGTSILR